MSKEIRRTIAPRKDRFHIIVFNFERIRSFLDNFGKISNFRRGSDRLFVYDCSDKGAVEHLFVKKFCDQYGLSFGEDLTIVQRQNWGIDQGARIDYLLDIHSTAPQSEYIWQFQDHYLDLDSDWSRWPSGTLNVDGEDFSGQIKGDCIPDNLEIDLDACERILRDSEVKIIYADRLNIAYFPYETRGFFCIDGANFCCVTEYLLRCLDKASVERCRDIYDGTYEWSLFFEFFVGKCLSNSGGKFYDLVSKTCFVSIDELIHNELNGGEKIYRFSELFYTNLYHRYLLRYADNEFRTRKIENNNVAVSAVKVHRRSEKFLVGSKSHSVQDVAYAIEGRHPDGWMQEDAFVRVNHPVEGKQLTLNVEVPDWLPVHYPMTLQAKASGEPVETVEVPRPGRYKIRIPLDQPATVQLHADQWAVPAELGIGSDMRQLSYRLIDAVLEEPTSPD